MTNNIKDERHRLNIQRIGEWLLIGGGFVFICTVIFMSGVFVKESWDNTNKINAVEIRLGNIEKSINDLANKIDSWQHQAEVFKKLEQKVWESFTNK